MGGDRSTVSVEPLIPDIVTYFTRLASHRFSPGCPICLAFNWGRCVSRSSAWIMEPLLPLFIRPQPFLCPVLPPLAAPSRPDFCTAPSHMCLELGINSPPLADGFPKAAELSLGIWLLCGSNDAWRSAFSDLEPAVPDLRWNRSDPLKLGDLSPTACKSVWICQCTFFNVLNVLITY